MEARLSSTGLMGVRSKLELTCFRYSHEWRWGPWSANQDISVPRGLFIRAGLTLEQCLLRATGGLGSGAEAVLAPWPLPAPARGLVGGLCPQGVVERCALQIKKVSPKRDPER
jgi:hypothetical protein